jgi:hypothetical protein
MTAEVFAELHAEVAAAARRGWRLFPVEARGKLPLLKGWPEAATEDVAQLAMWAHQHRGCNWGLATGTVSGLVVIDVDGMEGRASLASLEGQGLALPETLTVATGRAEGGEHRYYRPPSGVEIRNDQSCKIGPHIDVRGTGGFVVCPPSIHASGKQYRFLDASVTVATLPAWIVERLTVRAPMPVPTVQDSPQVKVKGSRTNSLVSLAGTMTKRGMSLEAIMAALLAENTAKCDPPLPEAKVRKIAADIVERYPPGEPVSPVVPVLPPMTREVAARITSELLNKCQEWIRRYIVVSDEQAIIMAAWVLHTYAFDAAETTPYIHITAPERACGKSRLMEALEALSAAPIRSGGMTAAALVRTIEAKKPTIFLDEMDAQLGGDKEYAEAIRGILNEGFRKGGVFYKCIGRDFDLKDFNVFCPKCFAGIGALPDTVSSRSIVIEMRRKLPGEAVEPFRQRAVKIAALPIRSGLEEWAARKATEMLQTLEPAAIANLSDRQNDIAEPLLCIAHLAGDGWLQRLTAALQTVFKAAGSDDLSTGALLLSDIHSVFDGWTADQIPSKALAERLCGIEGRPWAEWSRGKEMTPNNLARQLKKFSIYPQTIRVGSETPKGYRRGDFEDAWSRYCLLFPTPNAATPQPASSLAESTFSNRNTQPTVSVSKNIETPHEQRGVADVAFVTAPAGAERVYEGEL